MLRLTDRAHERGADLGLVLQDLLELTHTVTRLKAVPALRDGNELPEAERTTGAALADRLSMPVLGRLWQMLLKGVAEVEQAPDRRAAAEMVLIRCCYVADLPTPGELVKRLGEAGPGAPAARPAPASGGGGVRAVANGAPRLEAAPALPEHGPPEQLPRRGPARRATQREAMLHANLLHHVHLVRFAPHLTAAA